jgi:hypothetical protein
MTNDMVKDLSNEEFYTLRKLNWEKIGIVEGVMKIEGITLDTLSEATGIYPTTLEMWLDYQILLDKLQLDNISTALNILA